MIPKVSIQLKSGGLGSVAALADGVAGLVIGCDPGASGVTAGDIIVLNGVDDAKTANLDQIPYAYQQIAEFYAEGGGKLYVLIAADTETLEDMADAASTNAYGKALLEYADGEISLLGVCREPGAGYTPVITSGLDSDSDAAIVKMQALATTFHTAFMPFVGFVEGRSFVDPATVADLFTGSDNFVGVAVAASTALHAIDPTAASVGLLMGRAASVPVQRKIARVKDGGLAITGVFYNADSIDVVDFASVANKGYLTIGKYANKSGFFVLDDTLATIQSDDFKCIANRRVMNKIVRLVYATYINELNDDILLTAEGKLAPATAKYYQGLIANAVNVAMTANDEISSFSAFVDMNQNVLSSGKIEIQTATVPKGYSQEIKVVLGFSNPALSV